MLPEQESVEVPEPVMAVVERVQVSPVVGDGIAIKLMVPPKPFAAVIVMVEFPGLPARIVRVVGVMVIVKSCTVNVAVAVWVNDPLVPVIVRM